MRILNEFLDGPRDCSYLPGQQALLEYQIISAIEPEEYEALMQQKFRKFGPLLFRPNCPSCQACQPIRVLVNSFSPNRSMKRCISTNNDLKIMVSPAINSDERINLCNEYHKVHADKKNWNPTSITQAEYDAHFLESDILIEEIALYKQNKLIGLMLFEELTEGISLIYHFYDPILRQRSLGTFLILNALEIAAKRKKEFAYLGYFVSGCKSMEYKARFGPNQVLREGRWSLSL